MKGIITWNVFLLDRVITELCLFILIFFSIPGLIFYRRGGNKSDGKTFEDFEARINSAVFPSLQVNQSSIL